MNKQFHEVAELFPLMQGTAFEELVADIRKNGLREPILVEVAARLAKMMEGEANKRRGRRRAELGANLHPIPLGESRVQAGALVNISPRLISYAIKVLRDGCEELVAAVESGHLPVRRPRGWRALARRVSCTAERSPRWPRPGPSASSRSSPGEDPGVVFLWVATGGLPPLSAG